MMYLLLWDIYSFLTQQMEVNDENILKEIVDNIVVFSLSNKIIFYSDHKYPTEMAVGAAAVFVMIALAGLPHKRIDHLHEQAISMKLSGIMGVAERAKEASYRQIATQQLLLPGHFEGLRMLLVDVWLDDPKHTCQGGVRRGGNNKDPLQYYTPQNPSTIEIFNRDIAGGGTHTLTCEESYTVDAAKKAYIRNRLIPRVVSQLSLTLAPRFRGSGGSAPITGNDATSSPSCAGYHCIKCGTGSHFVFKLPYPYAFPSSDVLILLSAEPDVTAATAFPCTFGSDGRPTSVVLNVAPNKISDIGKIPRGPMKMHSRTLQAMLHGLGFDVSLFSTWKQGASPNYTIPALHTPGAVINVVGSPSVKTWIENVQFRCTGHPKGGSGTIDGAELENALTEGITLPYWEKRLFKGDILTMLPDISLDYSQSIPVVSGLTLSAFKDMGWYEVNMKMEQPLPWLREQPCNIPSIPCSSWPDRYKCSKNELQPMCSPDLLSTATCAGFEWPSGMIPNKFRRDALNVNWGGGDPLMDFCPFRDSRDSIQSSCLIPSNDPSEQNCQTERCPSFQLRSPSSRCFISNLHYTAYGEESNITRGTCIPHYCQKVGIPAPGQPQEWRAYLQIGGKEYMCDSTTTTVGPGDTNGEKVCSGATIKGTVRCPDLRELCEEAGPQAYVKSCDPIEDCNARGSCDENGNCVCFTEVDPKGNPLYGMFAGERCTKCHEDYYGLQCKQKKCPVEPETGAMCYNHGQCLGNGICECYSNVTHGYWSNTTGCSTCTTGITGGSCKLAECNPAGGSTGGCVKGICNPTTLRCNCYASAAQGYWDVGTLGTCDRCKSGYDFHQSCKVRIQNYYACDNPSNPDILKIDVCLATCRPGEEVPRRVSMVDYHGCTFDKPSPRCGTKVCEHPSSRNSSVPSPRAGAPSGCPTPTFVPYDCKGFPNPYHDCWLENECSCVSPRKPQCIAGTDAILSPDAYPVASNLRDAGGSSDLRPISFPTSKKQCKCPKPGFRPSINCWSTWVEKSPDFPGGVQPRKPYKRGVVVLFEPQQLFYEDFCHCTSPPIAKCSDETKSEWLMQRKQGLRLDCNVLLSDFGCPNWDFILNVGGVANSSAPDLSLIDCDGWPAPKLLKEADPCGCPFPQFKCLPGTLGKCNDPPKCPDWDPLPAINCLGQMPPVLTFHGAHPCGCRPPPTPTCIPGTERTKCQCEPSGYNDLDSEPCSPDTVEWIECLGTPLEPPPWDPHTYYPTGDPFINVCDPCPQCRKHIPTRRCLPGTASPTPLLDNKVPRLCLSHSFNKTNCISFPAPCPVDCKGNPKPPETDYDPNCECPPVIPVPSCLPGTDGSPPDADLRGTPCEATPQLCEEYACGGGDRDVQGIAADLGLNGDYSAKARESLLAALTGNRYCVQEGQCSSHYHCAAGYYCGVCGLCLYGEVNVAASGCLADRGMSCGNFKCEVSCDEDGLRQIKSGLRDAKCKMQCLTDADCRNGAICSLGVYTPPPDAGAAYRGDVRVVGKAAKPKTQPIPQGIPGINPQATPPYLGLTEEPFEFVPLRNFGECIMPEHSDQSAVEYCTTHDQCDGYACGTHNKQFIFSNSRCMGSCHVNSHCHPDYRCIRYSGRCVPTTMSGSGQIGGDTLPDGPSCSLQDSSFCSPYWCGGDRSAQIKDSSICPMSCVDDNSCQPFYECQFPTIEDLDNDEDEVEQCNPETGVANTNIKRQKSSAVLNSDPNANYASKGKCVPTIAIIRRGQSQEDLQLELQSNPFVTDKERFRMHPLLKEYPSLVYVVGNHGGYQDDPNTVRLRHSPFVPGTPLAVPSPGTVIETNVAECFPYAAVMRGITTRQLEKMKVTSGSGNIDVNTGTFLTLPSCKSYCMDDADCAGGFFCTKPPETPIYTSSGGKKVISRGNGDPSKNDLGLQGADEDISSDSNKPRDPGYTHLKGKCQVKRGLGTACNVNGECGSSHCWFGICCNVACSSPCQTCERMGVCGWVVPHTAPNSRCPKCQWCEYDGDNPGPASRLECAPIPEGQDPNDNCGPHATCNGEGGCVSDDGWGGGGDTCSSGRSGPNCDDENIHFRTVVTEEVYSMCSPDLAARLSSSPAIPPPAGAIRVSKRSNAGFDPITTLPSTYLRRQNVIDRRPRQWASQVLGVSSHSMFGCSNILYEPSAPRKQRIHKPSDKSWAPGQYVKSAPGGQDENPQKRYAPWVNCKLLATAGACGAITGCKWYTSPTPGFCNGDPNVNVVKPNTVILSHDGINYDPKTIPTPQPYEWIELSFDSPIVIESIIIHENYNPGSIVKIESQPAPAGSFALAQSGGGAPQTDPITGLQVPFGSGIPPRSGKSTSPVSTCGALTKLGMDTCVSDISCYWITGECRAATGTCNQIGKESCAIREQNGVCHWDALQSECMPGRRSGCYERRDFDDTQHVIYCETFNDITVYDATTSPEVDCIAAQPLKKCVWGSFKADSCIAGTLHCSEANGKPDLCIGTCIYDTTTAVCTDGSFPNSWTRQQYCSTLKSAQLCGSEIRCSWVPNKDVTGCMPLVRSHCVFETPEGDCRGMASCEWVGPPTVTPAPTTFSQGCPDLGTYQHSSSAKYVRTNSGYVVSLACQTGYAQSTSVASCKGSSNSTVELQGNTSCIPRTCPDYQPADSVMIVSGYTTSSGFLEKQQGSTPILSCSNGNLTGTSPVCENGHWVGGSASCSSTGRRGVHILEHPSTRQTQRLREMGTERNENWWVPDHDYEGLTEAFKELQERWSMGYNYLHNEHRHHRMMKILATETTGTATAALVGSCGLNPSFEPDPTVKGDMLDWSTLCPQQTSEGVCINSDTNAEKGSPQDRSGKCKWSLPSKVDGEVILPSEPKSPSETGTFGTASEAKPFRLKNMAPEFDSDKPMPTKDETKPTPTNIRCEDLPANVSINQNKANYEVIWERPFPNFVEPKRYRELSIDVGQVAYRSQVIRITMSPTSDTRSMIDAVAIVGYQNGDNNAASTVGLKCKGEIWVSPVRDGTRSSANIQTASVQAVPCNGRGKCGPRGCECFGNFYGEGCETCKFGWSGTGCDTPIKIGCEVVAFEDLSQFSSEAEVRARWKFDNYHNFRSSGLRWQHFGSKLTSPQYNLGDHTHIKLDIGTLMVDVPKSDDCGIVVRIITLHLATNIIYKISAISLVLKHARHIH